MQSKAAYARGDGGTGSAGMGFQRPFLTPGPAASDRMAEGAAVVPNAAADRGADGGCAKELEGGRSAGGGKAGEETRPVERGSNRCLPNEGDPQRDRVGRGC